jgi:hypothetical protein
LVVDPKSAEPDELILVAPLGFNFTALLDIGRAIGCKKNAKNPLVNIQKTMENYHF